LWVLKLKGRKEIRGRSPLMQPLAPWLFYWERERGREREGGRMDLLGKVGQHLCRWGKEDVGLENTHNNGQFWFLILSCLIILQKPSWMHVKNSDFLFPAWKIYASLHSINCMSYPRPTFDALKCTYEDHCAYCTRPLKILREMDCCGCRVFLSYTLFFF